MTKYGWYMVDIGGFYFSFGQNRFLDATVYTYFRIRMEKLMKINNTAHSQQDSTHNALVVAVHYLSILRGGRRVMHVTTTTHISRLRSTTTWSDQSGNVILFPKTIIYVRNNDNACGAHVRYYNRLSITPDNNYLCPLKKNVCFGPFWTRDKYPRRNGHVVRRIFPSNRFER